MRVATLGNRIVPAYALTIHKAQGSEYEAIAVLLPDEDTPLLTRELLYTALTRSRGSVLVTGAPETFTLGLGRRFARSSGLVERIQHASESLGRGAIVISEN